MTTLMRKNGNNAGTMPDLLNQFFTRDLFDWGINNPSQTGTTVPAVNIKETADNFEVEVAAPGMKKDEFKIELNNNVLTISSEKTERTEENDNERFSRREFSYQSFERTFHLAKDVVDEDKIGAKYENGVLKLIIPKREEVKPKPARLINIS